MPGLVRLVAPLIGAGARNVPPNEACKLASMAATRWRCPQTDVRNSARLKNCAPGASRNTDDETMEQESIGIVDVELHVNLVEDEDADLMIQALRDEGWEEVTERV